MKIDDPPLLHIHSQDWWHQPAYIVGNSQGLRQLLVAIERTLEEKKDQGTEVFAADGEGYPVFVLLDDTPWTGDRWTRAELPYTDEAARDAADNRLTPQQRRGIDRK